MDDKNAAKKKRKKKPTKITLAKAEPIERAEVLPIFESPKKRAKPLATVDTIDKADTNVVPAIVAKAPTQGCSKTLTTTIEPVANEDQLFEPSDPPEHVSLTNCIRALESSSSLATPAQNQQNDIKESTLPVKYFLDVFSTSKDCLTNHSSPATRFFDSLPTSIFFAVGSTSIWRGLVPNLTAADMRLILEKVSGYSGGQKYVFAKMIIEEGLQEALTMEPDDEELIEAIDEACPANEYFMASKEIQTDTLSSN